MREGDEGAAVAFNQTTFLPHDHGKKRVGTPRKNWARITMDTFWGKVVKPLTPIPERRHLPSHYNPQDLAHRRKVKETAEKIINDNPKVLFEFDLSGP